MASDLDPPLRSEELFDDQGNMTLRFAEFLSQLSGDVNQLVDNITIINPAGASNSASFGSQLIELQQRIGSGDPLTWDETGFTWDSTKLTFDQTEA